MGIEILADYWPHIAAGIIYLNLSLPMAGEILESRIKGEECEHLGFKQWMSYNMLDWRHMFRGERFFHNVVSDSVYIVVSAISYPLHRLLALGTPAVNEYRFLEDMTLLKKYLIMSR